MFLYSQRSVKEPFHVQLPGSCLRLRPMTFSSCDSKLHKCIFFFIGNFGDRDLTFNFHNHVSVSVSEVYPTFSGATLEITFSFNVSNNQSSSLKTKHNFSQHFKKSSLFCSTQLQGFTQKAEEINDWTN